MDKIQNAKIVSGYTYVENAPGLARVTEALRGAGRVAVDTEADSLHHYFEKVCLIQLSFSGANFIIDPLAGFSLSEFFDVLAQKELIFHAADYDLRILKKSFGFRPQAPVSDTMIAAQVLGYEKIGLAALAEKFLGVIMPKSGQKADWSIRPLPERLLTYASDDTKFLETLEGALMKNLQALKRSAWHRECCERVVRTSGLPDKKDDKDPWRVKGSSRMSPQELVYLRELWKWRDDEARKKDYPPFYILKNEDLIELTAWCAKNPNGLQAEGPTPSARSRGFDASSLQAEGPTPSARSRGFDASSLQAEGPVFLKRFTGERLAGLENAFRTAKNMPRENWPLPLPKTEWSAERPDQAKVELLMEACKTLAKELKIESSFLAPRAALTAVIQHQPRTRERIMEVSGLLSWQAELLAPAIQKILLGSDPKPA